MGFVMFVVVAASGLLRKESEPKHTLIASGGDDGHKVDAHTEVDSDDTLANAQSMQFDSAVEACQYCDSDSFTKKHIVGNDAATGQSSCICMSFPKGAKFDMYCGMPNQLAYGKQQGACLCNAENMEQMGATTCDQIP